MVGRAVFPPGLWDNGAGGEEPVLPSSRAQSWGWASGEGALLEPSWGASAVPGASDIPCTSSR